MVVPLSARTERALRESAERLLRWLEGTQDVELSAVAHTLQRGRVAMAHRLAIVASSLAELRSSLTQYLAREVAPDCFVAELRGPHAQSDGEPSAPRDREACRALARAWAEGHATRWPAPRSPARRISLPGYPFARVRHWLAEAREQPRPARAPYDAVDGVLDAVCNQSISIDDAVGALLRELSFGEPLMH
jgi:acyl transferase domain-containing protein